MSVVAVKVYDNQIVMSADTIVVRGQDKTPVGVGKLFSVNDMLIGSSGYASEGVYMRLFSENHRPIDATEKDIAQFMMEFAVFKNNMTGDGSLENSYLLAYKGKCFYLNQAYIGEVKDFYAIGAGQDYADAALYLGHSPQEAVKVACALCCMVSEPIETISMGRS